MLLECTKLSLIQLRLWDVNVLTVLGQMSYLQEGRRTYLMFSCGGGQAAGVVCLDQTLVEKLERLIYTVFTQSTSLHSRDHGPPSKEGKGRRSQGLRYENKCH